MFRRHIASAAACVLPVLIAACGGSDKSTGPSVPQTIAIALSQPSVNVAQGASGTITVTVTRGGGFGGAVSLSIDGVPSGVQVSMTPSSLPAGTSSAQIGLSASTSAVAGNYNLTVRASGTGVTQQSASLSLSVIGVPSRPTADRADDATGSQIHFLYVLPSDGTDRQLDMNGTLANTIGSWQTWLAGQTGGRRFRLDMFNGALDITFVRLTRTDAVMKSYGAFVRDTIERELVSRGFTSTTKIYAVYYDGGSTWACGGGAWPPGLPGRVGVMYLQGTPAGAPACNTNPFATSPTVAPGYLEYGMIHEIIHTLGFVGATAPHQTLTGHVPEPNDLMYAGSAPWGLPNLVLDVGRDDYYGDNVKAGVPNLRDSPYLLSATGADVELPSSRASFGSALAPTPVWLQRKPNETGGVYSFLH